MYISIVVYFTINITILNNVQGCNKYGLLECERILHEIKLLAFYDILDDRLDFNKKQKRFKSYAKWTRMYHGVLGRGVRVLLSTCINTEIAVRFPPVEGEEQVGFRLANK